MNERIKELALHAGANFGKDLEFALVFGEIKDFEKFTKLLVAEVLDQVATRAYVCGDRAWSDELDRAWIELEFGYGKLHDVRNQNES